MISLASGPPRLLTTQLDFRLSSGLAHPPASAQAHAAWPETMADSPPPRRSSSSSAPTTTTTCTPRPGWC
ncbi:MAG: hypothetical protein WKG07_35880 [Hymenobacter sp.]